MSLDAQSSKREKKRGTSEHQRLSAEFRMSMMPIAEIIHEIDDYLSRLRQAREILSGGSADALQTRQKRAPRSNRKALVRLGPDLSNKTRADKDKPSSNYPVAHLETGTKLKKRTKLVDTSAPVSAIQPLSDPAQPAITEPDGAMPPSLLVRRVPAKVPRTFIRSVRDREPKPAAAKTEGPKPAIALAGPMSARIVVVPAEQVKRERETAAHPEVRRPRVPASGLTGKLAFEALFKNETDPA